MIASQPQLEFRLPISPTKSFYDRVHFFCATLRRLGKGYADATVRVTVGGAVDLRDVRRANSWSENYPVEWWPVPDDLFQAQGYFGTSDFRYHLPETSADLVILADADIALIKPFGPEFHWMEAEQPCIAGHMAHLPPPVQLRDGRELLPNEIWPLLFREFSIPWPDDLYPYSMDLGGAFARIPAYYNLGLVVLNRAALRVFQESSFAVRDRLNTILTSEMRCQVAGTLISYQHSMRRQNLSAAFNATNDERHRAHNRIALEDIRLIHYLRRDEIDRETFLGLEGREHFLNAALHNPVNRLLQQLAREIIDDEWQAGAASPIPSAHHAHP
jgi:hypothetical protein